ncbi:serine hydrolase-like protein isoform X2 [Plodia interpunctella]|uniref:serine hydrolase-like protein isoform X2 n=1 Tax=Plodia interpunctella TaxID=58824 RepID=UPI0023685196|nr:serine hydrolase-like protein isoform X2 [Plodia interpunctella]
MKESREWSFQSIGLKIASHGKSDFLPSGPLPTHTLFLEVIRRVLLHLEWNSFLCIGHSMGCVLAMLHDNLYPGQMAKLVCLDPLFGLMRYTNMADHNSKFVSLMFYERYYDTFYHKFCQPTISTYEEALDNVVKHRKLSKEQAKLVLPRNLTPLKDGLYRVSPQKAAFQTAHIPATFDILEHIFNNVSLPVLLYHSSQSLAIYNQIECSSKSICLFNDKSSLHKVVCFEGIHDQHIVRPDFFVPDIVKFLEESYKSKL